MPRRVATALPPTARSCLASTRTLFAASRLLRLTRAAPSAAPLPPPPGFPRARCVRSPTHPPNPTPALQVVGLGPNRAAIADALSPLQAAAAAAGAPPAVAGGEGAIYFWARLPRGFDAADEEVVAWLIREHGVCVIPVRGLGCMKHWMAGPVGQQKAAWAGKAVTARS
jgi:hypothetical protein